MVTLQRFFNGQDFTVSLVSKNKDVSIVSGSRIVNLTYYIRCRERSADGVPYMLRYAVQFVDHKRAITTVSVFKLEERITF